MTAFKVCLLGLGTEVGWGQGHRDMVDGNRVEASSCHDS